MCSEDPYLIITQIDIIYWIQWHPRGKMMAVHLDRLALYVAATRDEDGAV
jgi:hypothetical protein